MNDHSFKETLPWRAYTYGNFERYFFEGGHFFIKDKQLDVLRVINQKLV